MPFSIIKGQFRILHTQPDGDSVRFYPDDPEAFTKLNLPARTNASGGAQLRLDAIDALETHYTPPSSGGFRMHQPLDLAHAAGTKLLDILGFSDVVRDESTEAVTAATPEITSGYILTRFADMYGRPVSFVFPGSSEENDLSSVYLTPVMLTLSANYQLAASGLVYPTYYSKLFPDLRDTLTQAVADARDAKSGVWPDDATNSGATIPALADIMDTVTILPKLFRRLAEYFAISTPDVSLAGFKQYLATLDDRLIVIPGAHFTSLDTIVTVDGQTVSLANPPEELVFIEG
jgi:endonuclease YncB( thermonuclease family)